MTKTAKEYQTALKVVFDFAVSQEETVLNEILQSPHISDDTIAYHRGVIAGLKEAKRKIDVSDFLIGN